MFVSEINVGELFYIIGRRRGKSAAEQILSILEDLPIQRLEATYKRVIQAAGLKRELAVSYADCFFSGSRKVGRKGDHG